MIMKTYFQHTLAWYPQGYCVPSIPWGTLTLTLQNPYPWVRVRVLGGRGKGSKKIPRGYPCQSLYTNKLSLSKWPISWWRRNGQRGHSTHISRTDFHCIYWNTIRRRWTEKPRRGKAIPRVARMGARSADRTRMDVYQCNLLSLARPLTLTHLT